MAEEVERTNLSTGEMIQIYLVENQKNVEDLARTSGMSLKTIYRILRDETKIPYEVAEGLNKLIPNISPSFVLAYDAKYQYNKKKILASFGITDAKCNEIVDFYKMRKLYPELKSDTLMLFKEACNINGKENAINMLFPSNPNLFYKFSKANYANDIATKSWLQAAYYEAKKDCQPLLKFNKNNFDNLFKNLKQDSGVTSLSTSIYLIKNFCLECGINFYFRKSIPNARIKAIAISDIENHVFILISDLFKSIENLWISFVHECEHIKNNDLIRNFDSSNKELINEKFIDKEAALFFVGTEGFDKLIKSEDANKLISDISSKYNAPIGIVAEIYRFKNNVYNDPAVNRFLHYYNEEDISNQLTSDD